MDSYSHVHFFSCVHIQIFFRMSSCKPFADILEPVSRKKFFSVFFMLYASSFPCRIGVAINTVLPNLGSIKRSLHYACIRYHGANLPSLVCSQVGSLSVFITLSFRSYFSFYVHSKKHVNHGSFVIHV